MNKVAVGLFLCLLMGAYSSGQIVITEVDPTGSSAVSGTGGSSNGYVADWFELTNTGLSSVDISGWKMDDNSHLFANAVAMRGITTIAPGQSVVFIESDAAGANDATLEASFKTAWFGSNVPAGFTMGAYGGSGVGLGTTGDEVNIYDSLGNRITGVGFGVATLGVSFDNKAGIGGTTDPLPLISTISAVGVNGAFAAPTGEIGSPGVIGSVAAPEPASLGFIGIGASVMLLRRRKAL